MVIAVAVMKAAAVESALQSDFLLTAEHLVGCRLQVYHQDSQMVALCVDLEECCLEECLQHPVEAECSWCCLVSPDNSFHCLSTKGYLSNLLIGLGQGVSFGEVDVFLTKTLRSQHCWKILNLF